MKSEMVLMNMDERQRLAWFIAGLTMLGTYPLYFLWMPTPGLAWLLVLPALLYLPFAVFLLEWGMTGEKPERKPTA